MNNKLQNLKTQGIISELSAQKYLQRSDIQQINLLWALVPKEFHLANPRQILFHLTIANWKTHYCRCGNKLAWNADKREYRSYCSRACTAKYTVQTKKQQNMKTLGVEWHSQTPSWADKVKQTSIAKFGTEHYSKSEKWRETVKQTSIAKYGVSHVMHLASYKQKVKDTNLSKYGVISSTQIHISSTNLYILQSASKLESLLENSNPRKVAHRLGVDPTTVHSYIHKHGIDYTPAQSYIEQEMEQWLLANNITFQNNTRAIITPLELDFYLPKYNLAIEMNGDYWHSTKVNSDKKYHYNKWKQCEKQGIHLISIWECEWNTNQTKITNMLTSMLSRKNKGEPGRKCYIKQITSKVARPFVDKYHLQGFVAGTSHWGAFADSTDTLVGVMTFSWTRGTVASRRFELRRWVTDCNTHPGLFSKTFKIAQLALNFDTIVSFSDNRWFTGNLYSQTGFQFAKEHAPSYHYIHNNKMMHCSNFTKSNIRKKFPNLSLPSKWTEKQAMDMLGIHQTWDCGKKEWIWLR